MNLYLGANSPSHAAPLVLLVAACATPSDPGEAEIEGDEAYQCRDGASSDLDDDASPDDLDDHPNCGGGPNITESITD